ARASTRLTHRAAVLGLVVLVLLISYASSVRAWLDQRQDIATAEAQILASREDVSQLQREKRRWSDEAYVQQQARERLGYLLPGETGYRVVTPDGEALGAVPEPVDASEEAGPTWYGTLWASSQQAGHGR
nr:septum formation initiator family protein [Nocardioidaceae bacterium]